MKYVSYRRRSLTKECASATPLYVEQPIRRITATLLRHLVKRNACDTYTKFSAVYEVCGSKMSGARKKCPARFGAEKRI